MVVSLIAKDLNRFAQTLVSRTNIHPQDILKPMEELK